MPTLANDYSITGSIINDTTIGIYYPSTGNFNTLTVNNTGVSLSGHIHTFSDITNFSNGLSGLADLGNIPSGVYVYTTGLNQFSSGVITSFARSLLDDSTVADARNTLGLNSLSTVSGVLVLGSDVAQDIILSNIPGSGTIFNNQKKNIDFYVKGTGTNSAFYYDASYGRLGINTTQPDTLLHIVSNCSLDGLKIETTTNCTTGVHLLLQHNPGATPISGSFPATISLAGRDDNGNTIYYAQLRSKAVYTDGDSDTGTQGELLAYVDHDSTGNLVMRLSNSGTYLGPHNTLTGASTLYNLMGSGNNINGNSFVILGNSNTANPATNNIIVGSSNDSFGSSNQIVGRLVEAQGTGNIINGFTVYVDGDNNYLYSTNVLYTGDYSAMLGRLITGSGNYDILVGNNIYNSGNLNIMIGSGLNNIGNSLTLIGQNLFHRGNSGVLIGSNNASTGNGNLLIGNRLNVVSTGLFICGDTISVTNVVDSLILEKNVTVSNASGIVIVGRGNDITSTNNVLGIYGYQNTTRNNIRNSNILGDSNVLSESSGSLVLGTMNSVSGTIYNDIVIGKQNYLYNSSNNNLFIGNLNNQSGLRLNNDGSITGTVALNTGRFINTIAIGNQNVYQNSGNLQISVGNKNDVNGLYGITVGNINTVRNGNYDILIGKSNYMAGPENILIGNDARVFGNKNVVLSPSSDTRVFGNKVISMGTDNGLQSNGSVVGHDNNLYGDNNNVYGSNNTAGDTKYLFTATIVSNGFASNLISFNSNITGSIRNGDEILVYVYNPTPTDNNNIYVFNRSVQSSSWDGLNTAVTLSSPITLQTNNPQSNPNSFNDAFSAVVPTLASGYIIKRSLGSNNYIYGDYNTVRGTGNTVVGFNNTLSTYSTGTWTVGNNLTHSYGNNYMVMGPTDATKMILGTDLVINTGLGIDNIYIVGNNANPYVYYNNSNRRVGILNTSPRSVLDVSGTITTNALRIGLSGNNGDILVTDGDGNITYSNRTTNSGLTGGITYRLSETLSSGIDYVRWNNNTNTLSVHNWDDPESPGNVGFWPAALIIRANSGMLVNANHSFNSDTFNLIVRGSGDVDNYPTLLRTDVNENRVYLHDTNLVTATVSQGVRITGDLTLPGLTNSGTLVTLSSNKNLQYHQIDPHTILTTTSIYQPTGYRNLRWFEDTKRLCLGNTTTHTDNSISFVENEYNTIISNSVAANGSNYTVFNRDGLGSWPGSGFVVLYSGVSERGLRIDYLNQKIGINTTPSELAGKNNALVVNGSIYGTALRLGESATSGYALIAVDNSGNLGFRPVNLNLASNTIQYPFVLETNNNITKLKLSSYDESNVALVANGSYNDLGRVLAWNGDSDSWYSPPHFRLFKGDTSVVRRHHILFGEYASNYYLTTQNIHAFSAGSFHTSDNTYEGSTQYLQYYLRGSGNGAATCELSTDFSYDDADNTPSSSNANVITFPSTNQDYHSWMYEAMVSVVGRNTNTNVYAAGAVKLVGAIKRLGAGGALVHIGNYKQDIFADNALNGIGAEMVFSPGTAGAGTMTIRCTGVANHRTAWSATVKINQLSLPAVL